MFTLTDQQAAAIAEKWNDYVNARGNLKAVDAHLIFHDNSDEEMQRDGRTQIEIPARLTKTGAPVTFYIYAEEVTQ